VNLFAEGIIASVGVSNLQHVDMNSTRNLFIFGISITLGLMIPDWLNQTSSAINTGASFSYKTLSFTATLQVIKLRRRRTRLMIYLKQFYVFFILNVYSTKRLSGYLP